VQDHGESAPAPDNTHAQEIMAMLTDYEVADSELRKVGAALCQLDALKHLAAMNVESAPLPDHSNMGLCYVPCCRLHPTLCMALCCAQCLGACTCVLAAPLSAS
jgi:hypothetical protein